MRICRCLPIALLVSLIAALPAHAASTTTPDAPLVLALFSSALALLLPLGLTLVVAGGLEPEQARQATLTFLAVMGLAVLSYWAVGFALQFGGIGLVDGRPGFNALVWEWSALPESWGVGWGMAGLSGFGLLGAGATPDAYLLFLSRLPWVITATLIPLLALRGRAPASVTLFGGALSGGLLYPLTSNWSVGGGWLSNLGRNLGLGHGLVDFAGAGPVFLVGAATALAGILIFVPRRARRAGADVIPLPPVHLPLLAITGAGFVLVGAVGWALSNPLLDWVHLTAALPAVNVILAGAGGALLPIAYTWFAAEHADPLMAARGLTAGVVSGLAVAGFAPPWAALALGAFSGLLVPLFGYLVEEVLLLDDRSGSLSVFGLSALSGLIGLALLADGRFGQGWNGIGAESYLGVVGQGVSGLWPAAGFQADWPGQLQAQLAGAAAEALFSFLLATLAFGALAALLQLGQRQRPPLTRPGAMLNDER
ncbi:hypothetical protein [Candidatus Amarolinea aalborgensis]|uniref:hypothetical protein n=1 Tax=Candidatus Amarolinea aalborgensis TaxID=2249329 RepID=UPI003BFA200E